MDKVGAIPVSNMATVLDAFFFLKNIFRLKRSLFGDANPECRAWNVSVSQTLTPLLSIA